MTESVSSLSGTAPLEASSQLPDLQQGALSDGIHDSEHSDFSEVFDELAFELSDSESDLFENQEAYPDSDMDSTSTTTHQESDSRDSTSQNGNILPSLAQIITTDGIPSPFSIPALPNVDTWVNPNQYNTLALQRGGVSMPLSESQLTSLTSSMSSMQTQLATNSLKAIDITDTALIPGTKTELTNHAELLAQFQTLSNVQPQDSINPTGSHVSGMSLLGVQGTSEFSNILAASRSNLEPFTATLSQPNWNTQVGDRINWMISQGLRQADIRLNPPELGMLEVRVQVHADQANIHFSTTSTEVKDVLDSAIPRLREMLAENGLNLGDVNVSQQGQQDTKQGEQSRSKNLSLESDSILDEVTKNNVARPISSNGVIDFYA